MWSFFLFFQHIQKKSRNNGIFGMEILFTWVLEAKEEHLSLSWKIHFGFHFS